MAICPKCGANMVVSGTRMVCPNISCSYEGYEIPRKIPSQAELLKKLESIYKENGVYISKDVWQADIPRLIEHLRKPGQAGWFYFKPD